MMISNGMMKNMADMNDKKEETKEENTSTPVNDKKDELYKDVDSLNNLMLILSSIMTPTTTSQEIKELRNCYHDLDKRVAVLENLMKYLKLKEL